jgi:RNA polymerase sigma-70 factor, ECF subfamily
MAGGVPDPGDPPRPRTQPGALMLSSRLLRQVLAGDTAAWRRLVDLYCPLVYALCRRAGLHQPDAEDVGQEVFAAVYRSLPRFQGDTFRHWLKKIVRDKLCDHWRRQGRQPAPLEGDVVTDDRAERNDLIDLVHRALERIHDQFEPKSLQVFRLVAVEGRPPAAVAAELGMTLGAVYTVKSKVLSRLREELGDP